MATYPDSYSPTLNTYTGTTLSAPIGLPPADRLTLQQQANALIADINRADNILGRISPVPTDDGCINSELPLSHALQVARERMSSFIERLDGLATHVGQI